MKKTIVKKKKEEEKELEGVVLKDVECAREGDGK